MSGTGKTPDRWISLCDRVKNNKAYVKENSEAAISTEKNFWSRMGSRTENASSEFLSLRIEFPTQCDLMS